MLAECAPIEWDGERIRSVRRASYPDPIEELVRIVGGRTRALGAMLTAVRHLRAARARPVEDRE